MMLLVTIFAIGYALLVLGMGLFQRRLMYLPTAGDIAPALYGLAHFTDMTIESEDGTRLQLWYHEAANGQPTIIYFHGNAGHLGDRVGIFAALAEKGFGVAAVSYRGYGKSEGRPHEKGIYADARAAIKWVRSRGIAPTRMAFYGESLGTGVAVKMATEFAPKHLFLQAPYTSVVRRAAEIYWFVPVRLLIRDHFDSLSLIRTVRTPLTIFHGRLDRVIPPQHSHELLDAANEPKRAIFFDTVGHVEFDNDILAQHVAAGLS
ncbi:MAG: alpha/beta hydrolase [Alphaproteobacteria bacterium]|nr:alpha/beta hydrolase [Alphaproteobacteria bacterium]